MRNSNDTPAFLKSEFFSLQKFKNCIQLTENDKKMNLFFILTFILN